jgi:hypothetical protein
MCRDSALDPTFCPVIVRDVFFFRCCACRTLIWWAIRFLPQIAASYTNKHGKILSLFLKKINIFVNKMPKLLTFKGSKLQVLIFTINYCILADYTSRYKC